ncbi:hypothetical protein HDU98_008362 [Podochytrium sp. JEL0797]|nr:hypothetical protein HDU98_008362 [Podochytrium sp. JEL0797]
MHLNSLLLAYTALSVLETPVMQSRGQSAVSVSKRQDMIVDGTDGSQDSDGNDHNDSYTTMTTTSTTTADATLLLGLIAETECPVSKPQKLRLANAHECSELTVSKRMFELVKLIRRELVEGALPWYKKEYVGQLEAKFDVSNRSFCVRLASVVRDLKRVAHEENEFGFDDLEDCKNADYSDLDVEE